MAGIEQLQQNFTGVEPFFETGQITAVAGEFARVRFTDRPANCRVVMRIEANGKTAEEVIEGTAPYATGALMSGDQVSVRVEATTNANAALDLTFEVGT